MGVDELGVDEMGVDEMGSRRSGTTPLYYLHTKTQDSSRLLWLCSQLCVSSGRKPRLQVFLRRGSNEVADQLHNNSCVVTVQVISNFVFAHLI